jgi:two-component system sensor histidine kinase UhpB
MPSALGDLETQVNTATPVPPEVSAQSQIDTGAAERDEARPWAPPAVDFDQLSAARLLPDEEPEIRRWLARELHDNVASRLTEMLIDMEQVKRHEDRGSMRSELEAFQQSTRQVLDDLRRLLYELRGEPAEMSGFVDGLGVMLARFEQRTGIQTHLFRDEEWPGRLAARAAHNLQAIVGEALRNVVHHSAARSVAVELRLRGSKALLAVVDDGIGHEAINDDGGGMGVLGMRERAMLVGGDLHIRSTPGKGTKIQAIFPLARIV